MTSGYIVDEQRKRRVIDAYMKHKVRVAQLSSSYGISRKTIYTWIKEEKEKSMATKPESAETTEGVVETRVEATEAPVEEVKEETQEPEVVKETVTEAEEAPVEPESAETTTCPNPSCNAEGFVDECATCGYSSAALISPL